jgi:hypothetical protein
MRPRKSTRTPRPRKLFPLLVTSRDVHLLTSLSDLLARSAASLQAAKQLLESAGNLGDSAIGGFLEKCRSHCGSLASECSLLHLTVTTTHTAGVAGMNYMTKAQHKRDLIESARRSRGRPAASTSTDLTLPYATAASTGDESNRRFRLDMNTSGQALLAHLRKLYPTLAPRKLRKQAVLLQRQLIQADNQMHVGSIQAEAVIYLDYPQTFDGAAPASCSSSEAPTEPKSSP